MKKFSLLTPHSSLLALCILQCVLCQPVVAQSLSALEPRVTLPCTVANVVDGDTVDVELRVVVRVRLLAGERECWAPESRTLDAAEKKLGLAAKSHLEKIAGGKPGLVTFPIGSNRVIDYMTLERLLADVVVDGKSIGAEQIRTKHASSTKGGVLGR
jgi:endonuclease YncB( thermonuclease family)